MKIKYLSLALISLALASCANNNASKEAKLTESLDSKVYFGGLTPEMTGSLPCSFFDVAEDVPYVTFGDFTHFFNHDLNNDKEIFSSDENSITNCRNGSKLVFDVENNKITCSDFDLFLSRVSGMSSIHYDPFGAIDDPIASLNKEKSTRAAGKPMSWNLDDYYMKLVKHDGKVYVPYSLLQSFCLSNQGIGLSFNGNDFYLPQVASMYKDMKTKELNDYGNAYYSGPLAKIEKRSEGYSKYFYGSFLFTMENFNGKVSGMNFSRLDTELDSRGLKKKLLSSDSITADSAIAETINTMFPDGGHTMFWNCGVTCEPDLLNRDYLTLMAGMQKTDTRAAANITVREFLHGLRGSTEVTEPLKMSGETAIITFDHFAINRDSTTSLPITPTLDNIASDKTSTFGILYNSFKEIEKNSSIKNVVIDVSCNGGGAAWALGETLGFLTNGDVPFTLKNPVTGGTTTEYVNYDTDLDGDFADEDSYEGKYDFYILTSSFSFSCGNALPCVAKENGYAKIIGRQSGGGDCVVGYGFAVDGTYWQMSGAASITRKDGSSVDDGASVDYRIDYHHFYDVDWIDSYLKETKSAA